MPRACFRHLLTAARSMSGRPPTSPSWNCGRGHLRSRTTTKACAPVASACSRLRRCSTASALAVLDRFAPLQCDTAGSAATVGQWCTCRAACAPSPHRSLRWGEGRGEGQQFAPPGLSLGPLRRKKPRRRKQVLTGSLDYYQKRKSPSGTMGLFQLHLPGCSCPSRILSDSRAVPGPVPGKWPPLTMTLSPLRKGRNGERGRKNREFSFGSFATRLIAPFGRTHPKADVGSRLALIHWRRRFLNHLNNKLLMMIGTTLVTSITRPIST